MKHISVKQSLLLFIFLCLTIIHAKTTPDILFIIVDGMGHSSITASRLYLGGSSYTLALDTFPTIGKVKTCSKDNFVTDSAAAATALATGQKTNNHMVSLTGDTHEPIPTILDTAKEYGRATGIVTNTRITHATPSGFFAHNEDRKNEFEIAKDIAHSNVSLIMGGGANKIKNELTSLKQNGWSYTQTLQALQSATLPNVTTLSGDHLPYEIERINNNLPSPTLLNMVQAARTKLKSTKKPILLVVESGRVDHTAHLNLLRYQMGEMDMLNQLLTWALTLENTLVIVTADHETGGLALNGYGDINEIKQNVLFSDASDTHGSEQHRIATWASGPVNSPSFTKGLERAVGGFPSFTEEELEAQLEDGDLGYAAHTAVDVPIYAVGPYSSLFSGTMDNTDIPKKIRTIIKE